MKYAVSRKGVKINGILVFLFITAFAVICTLNGTWNYRSTQQILLPLKDYLPTIDYYSNNSVQSVSVNKNDDENNNRNKDDKDTTQNGGSIVLDASSIMDHQCQPATTTTTRTTTNTAITKSDNNRPLLLKVPFYVYNNKTLDWSNENADWDDKEFNSDFKHADDVWMLKSALVHPMRTMDPSQAKLFFVPVLLNIAQHCRNIGCTLCTGLIGDGTNSTTATTTSGNEESSLSLSKNNETKQQQEEEHTCFVGDKKGSTSNAYKYVDYWLGQQYWFQRNQGRDHVIVASHSGVATYYGPRLYQDRDRHSKFQHKYPNLRNCNVVSRQGQKPIPYKGRYSLPSCYVGRGCCSSGGGGGGEKTTTLSTSKKKTHDFAMIASLHWQKDTFQSRRDICRWLKIMKNATTLAGTTTTATEALQHRYANFSVALCGEGKQCPALADARYGFHARGDTWGSNRVMDTFLSRTVPLFTNEEQYKILPSFVPWKNLTYFVSVESQESFVASLGSILSQPEADYQAMQKRIDEYMPIFDHTTIYRFDAYMAEFAKLQGYQ